MDLQDSGAAPRFRDPSDAFKPGNWHWNKKKLSCRVRPETGNPAGDELREVFAKLAGADLGTLLNDMKATKKKQEDMAKRPPKKGQEGVVLDFEADKKFRELLNHTHVLGASDKAIKEIEEYDIKMATTVTNKNLKKVFARLPCSPPKRVLLEIQRERSKPMDLPNQDESNAVALKLEKKREKERKKRLADLEEMEREEQKKRSMVDSISGKGTQGIDYSKIFKPYSGDRFDTNSDYTNGMMYLSRNKGTMEHSVRTGKKHGDISDEKEGALVDMNATADAAKIEEESRRRETEELAALNEGSSSTNDMGAKLYCAASLCNWSRNPSNAARLAAEGGVRAIIQLSTEPHPRIARFCAAAFRFMSEQPLLSAVLAESGVSSISDIVKSPVDEFIATNLAVALVNLTRINGKEGDLVDQGIVLALQNIIMHRAELSSLCARGLYNLTCVDTSYLMMDRVIRTLISLSSTGASSMKHICAAALCNLSDLKLQRSRLVEEGTIAVLSTLGRQAPTRTRRVCAVILQNLSASPKSVRIEMVIRSSVYVAHNLSNDNDPIILRCIGLTLARLSMEPTNAFRIVQENGISALCNIASKFPTIPGISQPVATAFQLLASRQTAQLPLCTQVRAMMVGEGCLTALSSFLHQSVDPFTLHNSLYALCNLLTEPDNHLPIVQQGLILTLVSLSAQENDLLKDLCALAFLNLSSSNDSHKHIVNAGAVASIIVLSNQTLPLTCRRCAAALCNVSIYEQGMARMVDDGIIPALVRLLSDDIRTIHYSCAALCRLCSSVDNALLILESGAVPSLVKGAIDGDSQTKQFCGAVLSTLSYYESCRVSLCEFGVISALKSLAELPDDISKQRCLVAFANISCEMGVQEQMVNEGVVSIIAALIANSNQEINYICCAKALCNLGCSESSRLSVAKQGGVHALLMVGMVKSVEKHTKLLCVLALNNLLDENTVAYMLDEGLAISIANLCKLEDPRVSNLCIKMFNHLTCFPEAMHKMVERNVILSAIFSMCEPTYQLETRIVCCRTTANLVLSEPVRTRAIEGGALRVLERGALLADQDTSLQCLTAIFAACTEMRAAFMDKMANSTMPLSLLSMANACTTPFSPHYVLATKILSLLSFQATSRLFMQTSDFSLALFNLIKSNLQSNAALWLAQTVHLISLDHSNPAELIKHGMADALWRLHIVSEDEFGEGEKGEIAIASTNAILAVTGNANGNNSCIEALASPETTQIIRRAVDALPAPVVKAASSSSSSSSSAGNGKGKDNRETFISSSSSEPSELCNIASTLFIFASCSSFSRIGSATPDSAFIVDKLVKDKRCLEQVAASVFLYLNDSKTRAYFANEIACLALVTIFEASPAPSEDCLQNTISAVYAMSKLPAIREQMSRAPISLDAIILRLSMSGSDKIKANCQRALKNLTSDSNEAIEEGAVSALIAMSLEGKSKGSEKPTDDLRAPLPLNPCTITIPSCAKEQVVWVEYSWFDEKVIKNGGAAGKGPDPPESATVGREGGEEEDGEGESNESSRFSLEELDGSGGGEQGDGRAKMAFAKMQIPAEVREAHLLVDADFDVKDENSDTIGGESSMEFVDANGGVVGLGGLLEGEAEGGVGGGGGNGEREGGEGQDESYRGELGGGGGEGEDGFINFAGGQSSELQTSGNDVGIAPPFSSSSPPTPKSGAKKTKSALAASTGAAATGGGGNKELSKKAKSLGLYQ